MLVPQFLLYADAVLLAGWRFVIGVSKPGNLAYRDGQGNRLARGEAVVRIR